MTKIGKRLKEERLRLKLSQSALGAIGGVETNAQGNYESGARYPRADYLSRIAKSGVDVTYVVTGLHLPPPEGEFEASDLSAMLSVRNTDPSVDRLDGLIERLQRNLHGVTTDLYQISRLTTAAPGKPEGRHLQLESIKSEAEAIALATMRLIFVTSRLN